MGISTGLFSFSNEYIKFAGKVLSLENCDELQLSLGKINISLQRQQTIRNLGRL